MKKSITDISPNKIARIAGLLYTMMIPLGIFGIMYVPASLIVLGDAAATANNIIASLSLFRLSIAAALIVQIGHLFLVLILYKLLSSVNKKLASLMVIFMLVSIPITMLNELNRLVIPLLLNGTDYLTVFTTGQLQALVPMFLNLHEYGIVIAGIFWGLWLFPMGYLIIKSGFLQRIVGVLLIIAGFGYVIDSFARLLVPNFGTTIIATIISFTMFAELIFPLWLLIKGVDVKKWEKRALESAGI